MQLTPLDNQVIFKKAFTDKFIFKQFVKDVLNIDFEVGSIETEKEFYPRIGYIDFKLDIYAESVDRRICIEIQRVEYDHHFDRFLHSFLMLIAEQQKSAKAYKIEQTVYMIVILTEIYTIREKNGYPIRDELLLLNLNPQTIMGKVRNLYNHRFVCLNPNYRDDSTPRPIRDWLNLIYQSIHNPKEPELNTDNPAIKKAAELISFDNLTRAERTESKNRESARIKKVLTEEFAKEEGKMEGKIEGKIEKEREIAKNMIDKGFDTLTISNLVGLSIEEIEILRNKL